MRHSQPAQHLSSVGGPRPIMAQGPQVSNTVALPALEWQRQQHGGQEYSCGAM